MKRVLFVDGSNLFGGLTELLKPGQYIDFTDLLKIIEADLPVASVRFYGTYMQIDPSKSERHVRLVRTQKAFFDSVKKTKKVEFLKGKYSGAGKEKGIDVRFAVDMVLDAVKDKYHEAVVMTGDADLVYATEMTRKLGKPVHLAALGSRFPYGMVVHVDKICVYDLNGHFLKQNPGLAGRFRSRVKMTDLTNLVRITTITETPPESGGGVSQ